MRSWLSGLLLLAMFAPTALAQGQAFQDVERTRYEDAFAYLSKRGALSGYPDGTARPYFLLNRAEALKILLELQPRLRERVRYYEQHPAKLPLFLDEKTSAWYAPYIEAGFEAGIITGYRDRTFRPGNPLKAEEAIVLILRAYGEDRQGQKGNEAWFRGDIDHALDLNLIAAEEPLFLEDTVTRGQFVDMVYRMDTVRSQKLRAFADRDGQVRRRAPLVRRPSPVSAPPPGIAAGDFRVSIPALGIENLLVTHPSDSFSSKGLLAPLKYGVGHLFGYPGGGGKILIYGHSSGFAWDVSKYTKIFRRVNELHAGEQVFVSYKGKQFVYEVTAQRRIKPNDTSAFIGRGEELILYTCWPPDSIAERLLIHAKPTGDVAAR